MALNLWWADDAAERYWMEITDREVLGHDLTAAQADNKGREQWSATLITETHPGDVVFHWHRRAASRPALVGWSRVVGPLSAGSITWQAHGTRGRERGKPTVGPSWTMQCSGFNALGAALTLDELNDRIEDARAVYSDLETLHSGSLYLPFVFYRPSELRANQAYLTKFPAALVDLLEERLGVRDHLPDALNRQRVRPAVGGPRQPDPDVRRAIEQHAVALARSHYLDQGATRVDELGKPYDLAVHGLGPVRHIEVKGSSVEAAAVELTVNEVTHANNYAHTDLVVVDGIGWSRNDDGSITTTGGSLRIWSSWIPADGLSITRYRYDLPADATGRVYSTTVQSHVVPSDPRV